MIRLILARHGNTFEKAQVATQVGARSDLPLTGRGCEQAESLARYLVVEKMCPKAIYAGSLERQMKTAQIISCHLPAEVHLHERALTEIDYGAWEGLTTEEIMSQWPQEYAGWTSEGKWAEGIFGRGLEDHLHDIKCWLETLRKTYAPGDTVIAITSNGVMRFFYAFGEGKLQEAAKVNTGHFCELLISDDSVKVKSWNLNPQNICI